MSRSPKIKFTNLRIIILVTVLIFAFGILVEFSPRDSHQTESSSLHKEASKSATLLLPSPTPTIKPIVYAGFCQNVPILLYHHIQPQDLARARGQLSLTVDNTTFESQMKYLVDTGYQTFSAEELAKALINHQKLPTKSIVITLDDGYEDVYTYAYPLLYKYQLKASLMIPTGLLGNPGYLSWDELKRMVDSGFIFAYDHTWSHTSLVFLTDEKAKQEILTAKQQLEEHLGKPVNIFAYPYGSENQKIINILNQNSFVAALSTTPGTTQCDSNIWSLHRLRIGNAPLSTYGL